MSEIEASATISQKAVLKRRKEGPPEAIIEVVTRALVRAANMTPLLRRDSNRSLE